MEKIKRPKPGEYFMFKGLELVALDETEGGVLCITAKPLMDEMPFDVDNSNNWANSSLREYLNREWLDEADIEKRELAEHETDLASDDGMTNYGKTIDRVSLLTCDQYRKYRQLIPDMGTWWWTATPWSCLPSHCSSVRFVLSSGVLFNGNAYNSYGVVPRLVLSSDIFDPPQPEHAFNSGVRQGSDNHYESFEDILTPMEAGVAAHLIGEAVFRVIREDEEVKSIPWLLDVVSAYKKLVKYTNEAAEREA